MSRTDRASVGFAFRDALAGDGPAGCLGGLTG